MLEKTFLLLLFCKIKFRSIQNKYQSKHSQNLNTDSSNANHLLWNVNDKHYFFLNLCWNLINWFQIFEVNCKDGELFMAFKNILLLYKLWFHLFLIIKILHIHSVYKILRTDIIYYPIMIFTRNWLCVHLIFCSNNCWE